MKTLIIFCALLTIGSLRTYTKCELAHILTGYGLRQYYGYTLADWVCLVQHESSYRTDALNHIRVQGSIVSSSYGLFQFNSRIWCDDGMNPGSPNRCHKNCADFLDDDISDDVQCAKQVVRVSRSLRAWPGWVNNCQGDLSSFLRECGL